MRLTFLDPPIVRQNILSIYPYLWIYLIIKPSQNKESAFNNQNHHSTLQN